MRWRLSLLACAIGIAPWTAAFAQAPVLPTAQAMAPLLGLPYRLYARQSATDALRHANCITAVVYALRRSGIACPALSPDQAYAHWRRLATPLRFGHTPVPPQGVLLFTRDHFLLLHGDSDANGVVDAADTVIHAPYRPVQVTRIDEWLREKRASSVVWTVPINRGFACPTAAELARLPLRMTPATRAGTPHPRVITQAHDSPAQAPTGIGPDDMHHRH